MLNPFKIYTPVRELVEEIKQSTEKYSISIDSDDFIYCCEKENTQWNFSVTPFFGFWVWKSETLHWTSWAEGWYIYSNLKQIALNNKKPQYTRQGWTKKLGLED